MLSDDDCEDTRGHCDTASGHNGDHRDAVIENIFHFAKTVSAAVSELNSLAKTFILGHQS